MRALLAAATTVAALVVLAGCAAESDGGEPTARPTDETRTPSSLTSLPSLPSEPSLVDKDIQPGGMGPYLIGARLTDLAADGLVGDAGPAEDCPHLMLTNGTEEYDSPTLVFQKGKLVYLMVDSPFVQTTEGARVTMTLKAVKDKHPDGRRLSGGPAGEAWLVTDGDNGLLFQSDPAGIVATIEAGTVTMLRTRYDKGRGC